jgi:hypothetical protein
MSYGFLQRWTHGARSSVVEPEPLRLCGGRVAPGWIVQDSLGEKVGDVAGEREDFLVVSRGWLRSDLYIPEQSIAGIGGGTVSLNEAVGSPASERWSTSPRKH